MISNLMVLGFRQNNNISTAKNAIVGIMGNNAYMTCLCDKTDEMTYFSSIIYIALLKECSKSNVYYLDF